MRLFNLASVTIYSRFSQKLPALLTFVFFTLLLNYCEKAYAQNEPDIETVKVRTDLVTVPLFVTQGQGSRVMNLSSTDFELRDNNRQVRIEYFAPGTERLALVFLLDASGSVREVVSRQREVALALLSRFGHESEVAVIRFSESADVVAPFSKDTASASQAFEAPALVDHRTAIFDAFAAAFRVFDARGQIAGERRIVIMISDGLDTVSATRPRSVIDEARNRGVSIYSIQIPLYVPRGGRLRPRAATKGLREVAEKSGGKFWIAGDASFALAGKNSLDLTSMFQAIEDDLRGQYILGYYQEEENEGGRFHRIDARLVSKDKRKLRLHLLRDGYVSGR